MLLVSDLLLLGNALKRILWFLRELPLHLTIPNAEAKATKRYLLLTRMN